LPAGATFAPQNAGRAYRAAHQRRGVAVLHVRELVALVLDLDVGRADAAHPGAADLALSQRVKQDHEPIEMRRMLRPHADEGHLILELPQVRFR